MPLLLSRCEGCVVRGSRALQAREHLTMTDVGEMDAAPARVSVDH